MSVKNPTLASVLRWGIHYLEKPSLENRIRKNQNLSPSASSLIRNTAASLLLETFRLSKRKKRLPLSVPSLYAHPELQLTAYEVKIFKKFISQSAKGKPLAYIIHKKHFYNSEFYIDERVLIPRPETELLVEQSLEIIRHAPPSSEIAVIDLGTGSGCIAISLARLVPLKIKILGVDLSKPALEVAQINVKKYKLLKKIRLIKSDLLSFLFKKDRFYSYLGFKQEKNPYGKILLLLANLPYISKEKYNNLPPEVKNYEPKKALYGGRQGLEIYQKLFRQISELKKNLLKKINLFLIFEISPSQIYLIKKLAQQFLPQSKIKVRQDYAGLERIVFLHQKPSPAK